MGYRSFLDKLFSLKGLYDIKQDWFRWLGFERFCAFLDEKTFIRPNHITIFNFGLGILALFLVFRQPLLFSIVMLFHFGLDNFDGYYARVRKIKTRLGRYIDHAVDFILGVAFLVVSALYFGQPLIWVLVLLFCGEMFLIWGLGVSEEIFPTRVFLIGYIFGWYQLGLVAQAIMQLGDFILFWAHKWWVRRKLV